jgi:hypothetical protein
VRSRGSTCGLPRLVAKLLAIGLARSARVGYGWRAAPGAGQARDPRHGPGLNGQPPTLGASPFMVDLLAFGTALGPFGSPPSTRRHGGTAVTLYGVPDGTHSSAAVGAAGLGKELLATHLLCLTNRAGSRLVVPDDI